MLASLHGYNRGFRRQCRDRLRQPGSGGRCSVEFDEGRRTVDAEQFGPYRLDELIGRGGMGEVYRAYDTVRKRTVALKRLPVNLANDTEFQARFRREAEVAARLTEPHIIPIHDFGEINGQLFIDMRLVAGVELADLIEEIGPLPAARAVSIISQLASALAAAHSEGLIHRDVKPSNVLISRTDRGEDYVHLVDFGIARPHNATMLTATGSTIGTLDYMAPEVLLHGQPDHRVDIYALGCVLYESLTGRRPFPTIGLAAKMYAHVHTPPPVPSQHQPGLPPALDQVVARAMAKDPGDRFRSTTELSVRAHQALAEWQNQARALTAPADPWPGGNTRPLSAPPLSGPDTMVGPPLSYPHQPALGDTFASPGVVPPPGPGLMPPPGAPVPYPGFGAPAGNGRPPGRKVRSAIAAGSFVLFLVIAAVGFVVVSNYSTGHPAPGSSLAGPSTAAPMNPTPATPGSPAPPTSVNPAPATPPLIQRQPQGGAVSPGTPVAPGGTIHDGQVISGQITAGVPNRYRLDLGGASAFAVADWQGPDSRCDTLSVGVVGVSSNNHPCPGAQVRFSTIGSDRIYQLEIAGSGGRYQFRFVTFK